MTERKPQTRLLYKEKIIHGNATCDTDWNCEFPNVGGEQIQW
jgi:hypothetical protein